MDGFSDGQLLLHQTNVPGQPGVEGCKTKADAEATIISGFKKEHDDVKVSDADLKTLVKWVLSL